jgi:hypothetical protein
MPRPRINPKTVRATRTWDEDLSEGSVKMRRLDLMNEVLTGHLPPDAVRRAGLFEELARVQYEAIGTGKNVTEALAEQLETLEPAQRQDVIQVLREFACLAIVDPRYVMKDDGDETHIPIDAMRVQDLMKVWNAIPPSHVVVDETQPLAAPSTEAEARRFPDEVEIPDSVFESIVDDGGGYVPPRENVPVQTIESSDGRMVEYAGC